MGARPGRSPRAHRTGPVDTRRRLRLSRNDARRPQGPHHHAHVEPAHGIPDDVCASLEMPRVGLKGPTTTPIGGGHQSINVVLRKKLGLYTNFRPVRMLPGLKTRYQDLALDLAIFRENTEDLYSGLEHEVVPGVVESLKIITQKASTKIARSAFEWSRRESRKK